MVRVRASLSLSSVRPAPFHPYPHTCMPAPALLHARRYSSVASVQGRSSTSTRSTACSTRTTAATRAPRSAARQQPVSIVLFCCCVPLNFSLCLLLKQRDWALSVAIQRRDVAIRCTALAACGTSPPVFGALSDFRPSPYHFSLFVLSVSLSFSRYLSTTSLSLFLSLYFSRCPSSTATSDCATTGTHCWNTTTCLAFQTGQRTSGRKQTSTSSISTSTKKSSRKPGVSATATRSRRSRRQTKATGVSPCCCHVFEFYQSSFAVVGCAWYVCESVCVCVRVRVCVRVCVFVWAVGSGSVS